MSAPAPHPTVSYAYNGGMTQTSPAAPAGPLLTDSQIAALEAETRDLLRGAVGNLALLREADAHGRAGMAWHEYLIDRFGDLLRDLRLPRAERRAFVASASGSKAEGRPGLSVAEQARLLGLPGSTIGDDRKRLDPADLPDNVVGLDSRRRSTKTQQRPEAAPEQARPEPRTARILGLLAERGPLTVRDVQAAFGWERQETSPALTRLAQAGRITHRPGAKRGQFGTWALA